jgi:transglutaminase-like putative cysteine protease
MKIKLNHTTEYKYSEKVFLEPHILRLIPQQNIFTRVIDYSISVNPEPVSLYHVKDICGESYSAAFSGMLDILKIETVSLIEFKEFNPYSFIIYPEKYMKLPFNAENLSLFEVDNYLERTYIEPEINNFTKKMIDMFSDNTMDFLPSLNLHLSKNIKYEKREEGEAKTGIETLRSGKGSCRDISQLFIDVCRSLNIPSKFVSGYYIPEELGKEDVELHAWVEVFIPGIGWMGFDPTHGIVCYGRHIGLCSAYYPKNTLPVSGFYRGKAISEISYTIDCKKVD